MKSRVTTLDPKWNRTPQARYYYLHAYLGLVQMMGSRYLITHREIGRASTEKNAVAGNFVVPPTSQEPTGINRYHPIFDSTKQILGLKPLFWFFIWRDILARRHEQGTAGFSNLTPITVDNFTCFECSASQCSLFAQLVVIHDRIGQQGGSERRLDRLI